MENQIFCQSCGMPLNGEADFGTNADGTKNQDYCSYCYQSGAFTSDTTMEEMIEVCVPHMSGANSGMSAEEARKRMTQWFPTLKRWKKA
ncbi:zinc ribbon domain-containing protein [Breznakiella homolactica]|uniref:Zinc ribbon domain-containing protein n=1 Tax=Breznakiella homolactica TaxID=2798577 RepID=A0A7T7XMN6_9SPIR|nr:zinc ribbon domain-containing protein [Breznakiella homolactica]QQO09083.1 zinc ribbon domain-containing protein [Breznakiella homolactica]